MILLPFMFVLHQSVCLFPWFRFFSKMFTMIFHVSLGLPSVIPGAFFVMWWVLVVASLTYSFDWCFIDHYLLISKPLLFPLFYVAVQTFYFSSSPIFSFFLVTCCIFMRYFISIARIFFCLVSQL